MTEFYVAQGISRATFQLAPDVIPAEWADICATTGIVGGDSWVKLVCDLDTIDDQLSVPAELSPDLRVAPIEPEHAVAWGEVMMDIFGMPRETLAAMAAGSVGMPGWHAYGVWDDDSIVATGATRIAVGTAQMWGGGTLPSHRRRGIQSALLLERAKLGRRLTAKERVSPNHSYR